MHPSALPNLILRLVKWPVALASLLALPVLPDALASSQLAQVTTAEWSWLAAGAGLYLVGWLLLFRHAFSGSYISTFEHELTHAIFAWATLHRVTGLRVTWRDGGACLYEGSGGGNWLISIGPYWLPTMAILPAAVIPWVSPANGEWLGSVVGFAMLYHVTSTWRETHLGQPDLQGTGFVFAAMFLPTANIVSFATVTLLTTRGGGASWELLQDIAHRMIVYASGF